jgi:hypothetical protein
MNNLIFSGIIVLAVSLSAPQTTQAQGTTYMSNLGGTSSNSSAVGSDSWLAASFHTGNNPGGYFLDSFQLGINDASNVPSGFAVMLYTSNVLFPVSSLGSLSGSPNPSTAGIYTYTAASNPTLSPQTFYCIVVTAATPAASGAYEWSASVNPLNASDGWGSTIGAATFFSSADGSSWTWNFDSGGYPQFAINATPQVPEPGVSALLALGGLCFLSLRRKAKAGQ